MNFDPFGLESAFSSLSSACFPRLFRLSRLAARTTIAELNTTHKLAGSRFRPEFCNSLLSLAMRPKKQPTFSLLLSAAFLESSQFAPPSRRMEKGAQEFAGSAKSARKAQLRLERRHTKASPKLTSNFNSDSKVHSATRRRLCQHTRKLTELWTYVAS